MFSQKQSYENFNSNANRHQSHIQLSQGGGGFARGTIFKSGKEWKMGGMAANANPQPGSASGYRQRKTIGHPGAAQGGSNAAPKNPLGMTMNTQVQSNPHVQELLHKNRMSDAGSRQSFATNGRGLPRTLWQRGAIFSTRLSRASVSAGVAVPHYQGTQPNGGAGQAGGVQASQHQLGVTAGTQGFYHQQYAQMAERINQDIDEDCNQR